MISIRILALALAFAGTAGLRAFVPLFFICHALRLDLISSHQVSRNVLPYLSQSESSSTYTLLLLLMVLEIALQKIPQVARLLDIPLLILRVASAMVAAFVVLPVRDLGTAATAAIVLGLVGAFPIMNLLAGHHEAADGSIPTYVNLTATTLTDGIALGACSIALQMPFVGLAFLHGSTWIVTIGIAKWRRRIANQLRFTAPLTAAPELPEHWHHGSEREGSRSAPPPPPERITRQPRPPHEPRAGI